MKKQGRCYAQKMSDSETGEAIYILQLIEKKYGYEQEDLLLKAMEHPRAEVRLEAIKLAERKKVTGPFRPSKISLKNKPIPKYCRKR